MEIKELLLALLIDAIKNDKRQKGFNEADIAELFLDENDFEMDSESFVEYYGRRITNEAYEIWYNNILCGSGNNLDNCVNLLVSRYLVDNLDDIYTHVLADMPKDRIMQMFITNKNFAILLLKSFVESIVNKEKFASNKEAIVSSNSHLLDNWQEENIHVKETVSSINGILRNIIMNLVSFYEDCGLTDEQVYKQVWSYFEEDIDPLGELEDLGVLPQDEYKYKAYMLKLMMVDIFEDCFNKQEGKDIDETNTACSAFAVSSGLVVIPDDQKKKNEMLEQFVMIQDEPKRRMANRRKSEENKNISLIKRYLPSYFLDEIEFAN